MKKVGIVGYGRFGRLLANILRRDFKVYVIEKNEDARSYAAKEALEVIEFDALKRMDIIFLAVPISALEPVLKRLEPLVNEEQLILDVASVKVHPAGLMEQYLKRCQIIGTHPLFGPDSVNGGLKGLKMVFCELVVSPDNLNFWIDYWGGKGIEVIKTTPDKHDHDMIYSLGLTQTLARFVDNMGLPGLTSTTKNFDAVNEILKLSLSDTDQLYHDMLYYNPYFKEMSKKFSAASEKIIDKLAEIQAEKDE